MKAIVVGRHELSGDEGFDVIRQEDINYPATSEACRPMLLDLLKATLETNSVLVFQMMPGQLAVACANIIGDNVDYKIGVIVNKPGERPAGIKKTFGFAENMANFEDTAIEIVKFSNPRANLETDGMGNVTVTVDPPLRFEFSHIEWF